MISRRGALVHHETARWLPCEATSGLEGVSVAEFDCHANHVNRRCMLNGCHKLNATHLARRSAWKAEAGACSYSVKQPKENP